MSSSKTDLLNFDMSDFKNTALAKLKAGQALTGKDGILTPLIKHLVEASLEGEMDFHLQECRSEGNSNRRNGKMTKTSKSKKIPYLAPEIFPYLGLKKRSCFCSCF